MIAQSASVKTYIEHLKQNDLGKLYQFISQKKDGKDLVEVLENLGFLPDEFDVNVFLPFLKHQNDQVRFWAVKNMGKVATEDWLRKLYEVVQEDESSMVRREAVSSMGRLRSPRAITLLTRVLEDDDPKVVLQAIRGLLVFRNYPTVRKALKQISDHPNEMVQSVIRREFREAKSDKKPQAPHPVSPLFMRNTVVQGDVREVLKSVPDESIHLTFTSPPYYNARDYSIYESYNAYLDFLTEVFAQVYRVTKEGRFLIVNTSPIIIPRVSRAHASKRYPIPFDLHARLVGQGWEFIDDIVWLKPETSVKNRNAGFLQHRKPLGYKPNAVTEYLMVYRKESDRLIDWNMKQYDLEIIQDSKIKGEYETSNVWKIDPTYDRTHSAVFPLELCSRVIKFYSYIGDLVFDPFGGSGTFGRAAQKLERFFFLTEQEGKYIERMKQDLGGKGLLNGEEAKFLALEQFVVESQKEKK
ncbi:MAG: DNA methyltransferase [Acidobacteriota bacterium]|nr:DNA methyltransferase [Acidobacteriota bacterium]